MRVLVMAPHPDDEAIGCGGSLLRHARFGHRITVAFMTSGDAGGRLPKLELLRLREAEARASCNVLGVHDVKFLRMPDGYIDVTPESLVAGVNLIRTVRPHTVYLPHAQDATRDHEQTHRLMMECVRRANGASFQECVASPWCVETVLGYETWTPIREPGYTVDITPWMAGKLRALKCHRSQIRSTRYDEAAKGLNRYRGAMTGRGTYVEAFDVLRLSYLDERGKR